MTLDNELRLSYYREIGVIDPKHAVKLVQHTETNRVFVMKTMKIYDRRVFAYLRKHPVAGVPLIEELVEDDGVLYVIEEYVSGENLRSRLDTAGPMQEKEAVGIVEQLCEILQPLHQQHPPIVHRDIKPGNIILKRDGSIVLVDFNSAKEADAGQSRDTVLIGTVGYAAPEQFGFSSSQPTTDIYAIGVLLNELLTGCLPTQKLYSGNLQRIIKTCLEMDPSRRYQTIPALKNALRQYSRPGRQHWNLEAYRRYLPPGFRTKSPARWTLAVCWYAMVFWISMNLQLKDGSTEAELMLTRLLWFGMLGILTFWGGNYLNVWDRMPLSKSRKPLVRVIGIIGWGYVFMVTLVILAAIIPQIVFS